MLRLNSTRQSQLYETENQCLMQNPYLTYKPYLDQYIDEAMDEQTVRDMFIDAVEFNPLTHTLSMAKKNVLHLLERLRLHNIKYPDKPVLLDATVSYILHDHGFEQWWCIC
jgi:hypothetical protein